MTNDDLFCHTRAASETDGFAKVQVFVAMPTDCPDPALLRAEQAGTLPPELSSQVQAHVGVCRVCRLLQADLGAIDPEPLSPTEVESLRRRIMMRAED